MKGLGLSVAAGIASALMFLSVLVGAALGALLTLTAPLPLAMLGLSTGASASFIGALVGLLVVTLVAGGAAPAYAVLVAIPVVVLVRQSLLWRQTGPDPERDREWYPPGLTLAWLTGLAATGLLIGSVIAQAVSDGQGIEALVRNTLAQAMLPVTEGMPIETRDTLLAMWASFFPALIAGMWQVVALVNGVLAQALVSRMNQARRPSPDYSQLMLPNWVGVGLIGAIPLAFIGGDVGYVAKNLAVVLTVPYVLMGMAEVHERLKVRPNRAILLVVFYLVLVLFGWMALAVAGLGLVRHWNRSRMRPQGDSGGQEEE